MSSIKIKFKRLETGYLLRILFTHPMETGRRRDQDGGEVVAAHFIQSVDVRHNGKTVAKGEWGTGVSKDPYLALRLREASPGDKITVEWRDNLGQSDSAEATL